MGGGGGVSEEENRALIGPAELAAKVSSESSDEKKYGENPFRKHFSSDQKLSLARNCLTVTTEAEWLPGVSLLGLRCRKLCSL